MSGNVGGLWDSTGVERRITQMVRVTKKSKET